MEVNATWIVKLFHVVVARDVQSDICHVATVYQRDPQLWMPNLKMRRGYEVRNLQKWVRCGFAVVLRDRAESGCWGIGGSLHLTQPAA